MDKKKTFTIAFTMVLLIGCFAFSAMAQVIVGKIEGFVRDKETNEPLVGCNVIIEGTDPLKGAATNEEGYYYIMNVMPGVYDMSASYVGYRALKLEGLEIRPDQTTPAHFNLTETAIEMDTEVIVVGERAMIQADRTYKMETVNYDEIIEMPITDLSQLLATQSNVTVLTNTPYQRDGYEQRGIDDIRIRGGRNNEVSLMIDGMVVNNPVFGGFGTRINTFAIEQMNVQAGGFDASYGNALSGVVNITTREGGTQTTGTIEYSTSRPFGVDAFATQVGEANNSQSIDFSLLGPVKGVRGLSYIVSGNFNAGVNDTYLLDDITWDDHRGDKPTTLEILNTWAESRLYLPGCDYDGVRQTTSPVYSYGLFDRWINPLDMYKGWIGLGFNNGFGVNAKLTYRYSQNFRFSLSGSHSQRYQQPNLRTAYYLYRWPVGPYLRTMQMQRAIRFADYQHRAGEIIVYMYPEYTYAVRDRMGLAEGADVFPREELIRYRNRNRTGQAGRNVNFTSDERYSFILNHMLSPKTMYVVSGQYFRAGRKVRILRDYESIYKNDWWIFAPDWQNTKVKWEYDFNTYSGGGRSYGYDPWEGYYIMIGDDPFYSGDESWTSVSRLDITSQVTQSHQIKTGIEFNYRDMYYEDYSDRSRVATRPTIYRMVPKEGAIYLNDKIELTSIVVSLGTRIDYANAGGEMWADPLDPLSGYNPLSPDPNEQLIYNPFVKAKRKFKFSPRFGVAFPLTDVTTINFNFGHFYQNPSYRDLYQAINVQQEAMMQGDLVGNPSLMQEKSIQYELGMQHQIGSLIAVTADLWLNETTNQVGSINVLEYSDPGMDNPYGYSVLLNNNFGSRRGLDLSIKKKHSHYFSGNISYSWTKTTTIAQTSWEGSGVREGEGSFSAYTTVTMPKREQKPEWERPHSIRGNFNFQLPRGFGPNVFGFKPLSNFGVYLTYSGNSGWSYTPSSTSSAGIGEVSSRGNTAPFQHNINARLRKNFTLFDKQAQLSVNLGNVLNTRLEQEPYGTTGRAGYVTGYEGYSSTVVDGFTTNNFVGNRNIRFGFRIQF